MSFGPALLLWCATLIAGPPVRLTRVSVPVRCIDYAFALKLDATGVPRFDWKAFEGRPRQEVTRNVEGVILENRWLRVTLLPSMGRVRSVIYKPTGHEQLWVNPVAVPLRAHNDTGFWITWGGVEHVLPRGEHGTTHALVWQFKTLESGRRKAVRAWCTEPLTGLEHAVEFALSPDRPFLETTLRVHNPKRELVRFSHWTTALLAPGGGALTPRTEIVVPADRFVAADRPFNRWMEGRTGPARSSPLRLMEGWSDLGDLMATPLGKPFYAVYCHEQDEGVLRTLDLKATPGFDIWTWGFRPSAERQREFTAGPPSGGCVEVWNGTAKEYSDAALGALAAGATLAWKERLYVVRGLNHAPDLVTAIARWLTSR